MKIDSALQKAIDSLQIRDVYLRSVMADVAEGFEPQYDSDAQALPVQFKHVVAGTAILELDGDEPQQLFRVYIELGARWLESLPTGEGDSAEPAVRARVEGLMVAEYLMREHPGDDALRTFAMRNASYHVWPYWREFLASQCGRMNLPKYTLPAVQLALSRDDDDRG